MSRIKRFNFDIDSAMLLMGILYLVLPVIIFASGWLKLIYGIPVSLFLLYFIYSTWKEMKVNTARKIQIISRTTVQFWLITLIVMLVWVYLSGIGCLVWQNGDHIGRNPTFRDLATQSWPIIIDLSKENPVVQFVCGGTKVGYSYYFCWWLPIALISKIFALGNDSRNFCLFLYALVGIFLIVYFLCRKFNQVSYIIPFVFIFFSGLDAIPNYLLTEQVDYLSHLEWWSGMFQYSSNTTQLFWVFNQSIPIWLITILMLQSEKNRYIIGLTALAFAYSPWATIGIIPFVIVLSLKNCKIKELVNVYNIVVPLILLVFLGSFYMSGGGSNGDYGFSFLVYDIDIRNSLMLYLVFILFEVLVYFIAMGNYAIKYELYYVVFIELLLIPLFIIRDYNFIMRASIPALFILMLYVMRFFLERKNQSREYKIRVWVLLTVFLIGCITPMHEINRVVKNTMTQTELLQESCYSYANIQLEDVSYIELVRDQFFVYNYKDVPFYKYFAR